jgi:hypothetical protein
MKSVHAPVRTNENITKARVDDALGTANEALGRMWDRLQRLECKLQSVLQPEPPATPAQTSPPQPAATLVADRIFDIAASVDRCAATLDMLGSRLEV